MVSINKSTRIRARIKAPDQKGLQLVLRLVLGLGLMLGLGFRFGLGLGSYWSGALMKRPLIRALF